MMNDTDYDGVIDGEILHLLVGFDLRVPEESHCGSPAQSSIGNFFLSGEIFTLYNVHH